MAKKPKPKPKKKPRPKKDVAQTALSIVEKATGGKLANPRPKSSVSGVTVAKEA